VGQLAALDLDVSGESTRHPFGPKLNYLMKLTDYGPTAAVEMATKWKAKAVEAIA